MSNWSEADLELRLCRALDLARKAIHHFAIDGYANPDAPACSFGPEKVVAETAMLIYAASASLSRPNIASRVDHLAQVVAPHARSERVLVDIALHPALAFKFAVPHILLTKVGYPDAGFDDFLRSCASSQTRNAQDRPPSSSLERQWIRSLWNGLNSDLGWRAKLRDSMLNWPVDILGGLRTDAYAFTHLIMYCTDFGFRSPRLPRSRPAVLTDVGSLLARYMDAEDYDLAGELLLAWLLMGAPWVLPPHSPSGSSQASRTRLASFRAETSTWRIWPNSKERSALGTRWGPRTIRLTLWVFSAPRRFDPAARRR